MRLTWRFWHEMRRCENGVPYYLQHQVWKPGQDDPRGLGGDQIPMALSSWNLLHAYTGDEAVVADMRLMADYWLAHGLAPSTSAWALMPFPYNLQPHSGRYDGDMRAGPGVLQPDKAGSFGAELLTLYQITRDRRYLARRHAHRGDARVNRARRRRAAIAVALQGGRGHRRDRDSEAGLRTLRRWPVAAARD